MKFEQVTQADKDCPDFKCSKAGGGWSDSIDLEDWSICWSSPRCKTGLERLERTGKPCNGKLLLGEKKIERMTDHEFFEKIGFVCSVCGKPARNLRIGDETITLNCDDHAE